MAMWILRSFSLSSFFRGVTAAFHPTPRQTPSRSLLPSSRQLPRALPAAWSSSEGGQPVAWSSLPSHHTLRASKFHPELQRPPASSWGAGVGQKKLSLFQRFKHNFCASSSNTVEKYSLQELESRPRFSLRSLSSPLLAATFPPGKRWQGCESLPGTTLLSSARALLLTRFPVSLQLVPPAVHARIPGRVGAAPGDLAGSSCQAQQGTRGKGWNPGSAPWLWPWVEGLASVSAAES